VFFSFLGSSWATLVKGWVFIIYLGQKMFSPIISIYFHSAIYSSYEKPVFDGSKTHDISGAHHEPP
jgi:hypothetical protein